MSSCGNTVQCGVYLYTSAFSDNDKPFPIPFSGTFSALHVPNDADDYYLIYPGFKVVCDDIRTFDNTNGTRPAYGRVDHLNRTSKWNVYYMNEEITIGSEITQT